MSSNVDAGGEGDGRCSDASEAPTRPRYPKFVAESLRAAPPPQAKDTGTDSPPLPLTPAHLPSPSPPAIHFAGKGGCGLCNVDGLRKTVRRVSICANIYIHFHNPQKSYVEKVESSGKCQEKRADV